MSWVEEPASRKTSNSLKTHRLERAQKTACYGPAIAALEAASAGSLPFGARNLGTCGWQRDLLGHACAPQEDKT